jgi:hypothetical protein
LGRSEIEADAIRQSPAHDEVAEELGKVWRFFATYTEVDLAQY